MKEKILKIFGSLFLFLFLSCTAEDIIEEDCIKVAKHCITNRDQTITLEAVKLMPGYDDAIIELTKQLEEANKKQQEKKLDLNVE